MKTYEIKIKAAAGQFFNVGESYSCLESAMIAVKVLEDAFRSTSIFLFSNGHIVCKTGKLTPEFRNPFYALSDGFHSFATAAGASGDGHLVSLAAKAGMAIREINDHLDSNYKWD